ncbi:unnamed protein product [Ambrosiozyma monospora]|uniref:Unnamed protein product n=1 Tax=Ambrosiozyma monospora TaxID=43982 RepID=A0ACB5TQE3_AMBMO|nr:unnamed protein product [Ambrosiozyma monospora]
MPNSRYPPQQQPHQITKVKTPTETSPLLQPTSVNKSSPGSKNHHKKGRKGSGPHSPVLNGNGLNSKTKNNSNNNGNGQRRHTPPQHPLPPQQATYLEPDEVAMPDNLWLIIISIWTGSFLSAADSTIVATTTNKIASSMHGSNQLTWIAASYLITNAIFQPLCGKISEIYGRRTTLLIAQFWFGLGCLCCCFSQTVLQFSLARAITGVGGGGLSALSSIIVTDVVPLRLRGMFQGYANLMYGLGQFLGPVIGGLFITVNEKNGWRWMFGLQVPLVMVASWLVYNNVHEFILFAEQRMLLRSEWSSFKKIDLPGSLTLSVVIVSFIMIFNSQTSLQFGLYLGTTIVFGILFWAVECYLATEHIIPPFAFRGVLRLSAFAVMFGTMTIYGLNFIIPIYLQVVQDFTSLQLSIFNGFGVFSVSIGSLLAGWFLKHEKSTNVDIILKNSVNASILGFFSVFAGALLCMLITINAKPSATESI